jgi:hypothetical protein
MMEEMTGVDDPFLEEILLLSMNDKKSQVIKFMKRRVLEMLLVTHLIKKSLVSCGSQLGFCPSKKDLRGYSGPRLASVWRPRTLVPR